MEKKRKSVQQKIFVVLLVIVTLLVLMNLGKTEGWFIPEQPSPLIIDKTISLSSLSLDQKIAQMIIVHGGAWNMDNWKKMQIGGIHLFALQDEELFKQIISGFQENMTIPFLVTADLEGCWNPFANFKEFTATSDIESEEEAMFVGAEEGQFLKEMGFTLDFSPVVDLKDEIWRCRSFPGDEKNVAKLASAYIQGMQGEGIIATAKHYPGKTLVVRDPHKYIVMAQISEKDQYPFNRLFEQSEVKAVMVSHIIPSGEIDSNGVPAVVSKSTLESIKQNYSGLIISDEINMLGLKNYYATLDEMYIAVFAAGNDLIINFNDDPNEIYRMIRVVAAAVNEGKISEKQIDSSVRKILEMKGIVVK